MCTERADIICNNTWFVRYPQTSFVRQTPYINIPDSYGTLTHHDEQHPLFVRHPRDAKHHTARVVRYPWLSNTTVLHTTFIQYSRHHMQSYLILTVHHDAQHPLFVRHPRDAKHHTARVVRYPWLSYTTVLNIHCIILYI